MSVPQGLQILWQPGVEFRHLSIDRFNSLVAGHRDAVVAVQNEVRVADLVQAHGRKRLAPVEGSIYALPPRSQAGLIGQKDPVELRTPADAPNYLLYPHHPSSEANAIARAECPPDLLEAGQPLGGRVVPQISLHPPEECLPVGA